MNNMTARLSAVRERIIESWHRDHETDAEVFIEAVSDCPLMFAGNNPNPRHPDKQARDNKATAALMQILIDYRNKDAQTLTEKALGAWLDSICRENVERMVDKADDRGDFLEVHV